MENNFISSLLYDYPTPLDETLTRHFDDNVHLFHWQPVYMIHFFLSLSSMLMSSKFQTKYGIRRVFFTCWRDEGIVRLTILTEKKFAGDRSTQKSMKVRTFNLKSKPVANRYMLSSEERKFMELLSSGRADGSIDDALSKYVVDLYKNEQALEGIDITEYPADYAVYTVNQEKIYKNDKPGPHTRIRMKFLQSVRNQDLKKSFQNLPVRYDYYSFTHDVNFNKWYNVIMLFTDVKIILPNTDANFNPDALFNLYEQYYSHKLPDDAAVEKFKSVFTGPGGLSDLFKEMMLSDGVLAECAFAHAPLFLLSYSYPTDINVNQRLSSSGDVSSVDMTILTRPKSTYSNGAPNDVPIICSFRESRAAPIKPDEAPRGLSLTGHIGGMSVSLFKKVVDTSFGSQTERCDIVHDLFHAVREGVPEQVDIGERAPEEDIGEEAAQQADMQPQFLKLIEGELEKIRPSSREYKLSEKNYLSRYFAGWIASSNHEATRCSQLLSKSGNNERSRFFLENYGQKMISKSKLRNILLIVKEEQMLEKHTLPEAELDEAYDVRYKQLKDDDTLVLNIYQEYVHTKEEFAVVDYDQDFTRYRVMYSFTKSEDVLKSHDVVQIPTTPVKNILNHLTAREINAAEKKLISLFESAAHILETKADYRAFIDGLFSSATSAISIAQVENIHADLFFVTLLRDGQVLRINFKALLDDNPNQKMMDIVRSANNEMQLQPNDLFFQFVVAKNDYALKGRLLDREQLTKCASRVRRSSASVCESGWTDDVEIMKEIKNKEGELEVVGKGKYGKSPNQMSIAKGSISPKAIESLKKVSKIGGYFMLGFMVRDIVSDAVNKHYGAMAKDIGFLVAAVSAPTLGELAEVSGSALVASGAEVSGNALKFVGFGLKRAISLYVFADFVENAIAYAHDTNNTEAAMSMAIDGAFVAIDLLTIAAESFGVLAFMGPLGEIAGVILLVGLNIYQTVEKVEQIESMIPLSAGELIDESLRAFFHLNIEDYVQELATEKMANDKLMKDVVNYLKNQRQVDTFITESVDFSTQTMKVHSDNIIDMRYHFTQRISRASPGVNPSIISNDMQMACYLHEEKIEIQHEPGFWENFTGFLKKEYKKLRLIDRILAGDYENALQVAGECDDNCIKRDTPTCQNSFGISKKFISQDNAALFKLGSGSDLVNGYQEKPNIFQMADGVKNITAGRKNDVFILTHGLINGMLDASEGFDVLDLSSLTFDSLEITENMLEIITFFEKNHLLVKNFEMIILPQQDNFRGRINVLVGCEILKIVSHGEADFVIPADDCANRDLTLDLSNHTVVFSEARKGNFIYTITQNTNFDVENVSLALMGVSPANHTIFLKENFWNIQRIIEENGAFFFTTANRRAFRLEVSPVFSENIKLAFNDGSMVMFNGTFTVSATLSTNLTIKEIEHVYTEALERLGLLMVAHSFTDDETITISHGKIEVSGSPIKGHILHNSVDHSTHMMLNGGEYLILINTNQQGKIEKTTIKSRNAANITRVVIDLNQVIEYYYRENDSFVEVSAHLQSQSDLIIEISLHESGTTVELGNILIQDIFSHNLYNKISIRNYGELIIYLDDSESSVEEGYSDRNDVLIPSPIAFGNQSDVIVLTPYNVEPFNEIILDFNVVRFDYYHINKTTLVVTNARYSISSGTENMLTVFLERFYTIEKMTTLQLMIGDVPMKFRQDMDKILAAQEFSQLWEDMPSAAKDLIAS